MSREYNDIEKKIIKVLDILRPYLNRDGGDVEFIKFEDGIVYVSMLGACMGCAGLDDTLNDGIQAVLVEEVPEVIGVKNVEPEWF